MTKNSGNNQLRVGIVGMGPIGSTLAAHLIEAGAFVVPCDINRNRIDQMKKMGIRLEGKIQKEVDVTEGCYSVQELGRNDLDLVAISVKTSYLRDVTTQLLGMTSKKPFVMCVQNGLDNELEVAKVVGEDRTLRMVINYAGGMSDSNSVHVTFFNPPNYVAALTPKGRTIEKQFAELLSSAGLETEIPDDIQHYVWEKVILNAALAPVCAITRLTMKEAIDFPEGLELAEAIVEESLQVAKAEGIEFDEDFKDFCVNYLKKGGYHRPSMLVDLEKGLPTEIDYLNGRIAEYGQKHNLLTPVNQSITTLIHLLEYSQKERTTN